MDFVVYGTGYGATLMLLGYALRTWGPKWRLADQDEGAYDHQEFHAARASWTRFAEGLGAVVATCGAVLVLFTFVLMLLNPGDDIGVMVCLIVTAASLIGVAVWAWMYFERYGSLGVVRMPQPLTSYQPLRYDPNVRPAENASAEAGTADGDEFADDVEHDDAAGIAEDIDVRAAKFATHHPDGEMEVGTYRERGVTAPDAEDTFEAEDETRDDTESVDDAVADDAQIDAVVEPGETDVDAEADDVAVDAAGDSEDVTETAGEADDKSIDGDPSGTSEPPEVTAEESVVEETAGATGNDTAGEGETEPAPEVLPEAHEPAPEEEPTAAEVDAESGRGPGGREEALRRLRERRRQREDRGPDDA